MSLARINSSLILIAALCLSLLLAGCGFQMRGTATLPFQTLYVDIPAGNAMGAELKRNLRAGTNVTLVDRKEDAEAVLTNTGETRTKLILSINTAGRVREFRLRYGFTYSLVDKNGQELAPPADLIISRDYSFNENAVLAKESEEQLLYRDMQSDLVQQVLRRLAVATPKPAP